MKSRQIAASLALIGALISAPLLAGCTDGGGAQESRPAVSLPAEFPSDFTVTDGKIIEADTMGDDGWAVTVVVNDEAAQKRAVSDLEQEGYVIHGSNTDDKKIQSFSLNNGERTVTVVLTQADGEFLVDYSFASMTR
ncbi:hypothetical protein [Lysinibacter cavernae]|uniref:Uncharacterized protein n=1 Tax=Lysinibacter cavernae TaxID=1640652 RepID=A0A7X5R234_9MICO|nr:hypothetical protein [Lysinibacter cavernae]NIH54255.1 hypothetical protein [Lysinibacter cavernae]